MSKRSRKLAAKKGWVTRRRHERERSLRSKRGAETKKLRQTRLPSEAFETRSEAEVARVLERKESEVRRWKEKGGAPRDVLDATKELAMGRRPAPLLWEHGRSQKVTKEERSDLFRKLERLVAAQEKGTHADVLAAYRAWRRAKLPLRRRLSRAAWGKMLEKFGNALGLPDVGAHSVERFKRS